MTKEHDIESSMREDVYRVVRAVHDKVMSSKEEQQKLSAEDLRFLKKVEVEFRRNGLALTSEKQQELKGIPKRRSIFNRCAFLLMIFGIMTESLEETLVRVDNRLSETHQRGSDQNVVLARGTPWNARGFSRVFENRGNYGGH